MLEVSGKERLYFGGFADAGSPFGTPGTLLLDPKNITIDAAGSTGSPTSFEFVDPQKAAENRFGNLQHTSCVGLTPPRRLADAFGPTAH